MKLKFGFITNYKSIKDRQKLTVQEKVTAIIGKNETGKSNIINIIGAIDLLNGIDSNILKRVNSSSNEDSAEVELQFELSEMETQKLCLEPADKVSKFIFSNDFAEYKIKIEGAISNYFNKSPIQEYMNSLDEIIKDNIIRVTDNNQKQNLINRYDYLKNLSSYIFMNYKSHILTFQQLLKPKLDKQQRQKFDDLLNGIEEYIHNMYSLFPIFHKFTDSDLKTSYTMNKEFFDKFNTQDTAVQNLISASGCSLDEWQSALLDNRTQSKGVDAKRKIRSGFKKIEKGFNDFYNQEEYIEILPNIDGTIFQLYIDTTGISIDFSERSNGLKWYFNLYIELLAHHLTEKQVVFLIDEPGVFLHVDAQKEVLSLFDNLTKDKNQIIYSTHSPYMIDEVRTDRIIPIQKSEDGNTLIFSSIQSDRLELKSRIETLSPLLEALGMKLYQNIGMQKQTIHIVTEGVTDAMYLNSMIKYYGIEKIKAIPSKGASQVIHMTFILWGLGYSFKTLFDFDRAGCDGAKDVTSNYTKGLSEQEVDAFKKKIIFYVVDGFDKYNKEENFTIESLIDSSDYDVLNGDYSLNYISQNKNDKMLLAKYFCDTIGNYPERISEITKNNYKNLLAKINPLSYSE